ncbi:tandem lipoprotein [Striga asiatica]|uniref:Tandem lipoprotein n=1 Tax=Striga asiatica TaxID=4170 RepID=A0A5A7PMR2_STRAF|nr:tandem lipoprotein [Striga asiatica]
MQIMRKSITWALPCTKFSPGELLHNRTQETDTTRQPFCLYGASSSPQVLETKSVCSISRKCSRGKPASTTFQHGPTNALSFSLSTSRFLRSPNTDIFSQPSNVADSVRILSLGGNFPGGGRHGSWPSEGEIEWMSLISFRLSSSLSLPKLSKSRCVANFPLMPSFFKLDVLSNKSTVQFSGDRLASVWRLLPSLCEGTLSKKNGCIGLHVPQLVHLPYIGFDQQTADDVWMTRVCVLINLVTASGRTLKSLDRATYFKCTSRVRPRGNILKTRGMMCKILTSLKAAGTFGMSSVCKANSSVEKDRKERAFGK